MREKVKDASAFIFTSFAGYFAEQPLEEISNICKGQCLVIEDASGAIGDQKLCNGNHSDIIVGSFGKWKPVDCGYGGWISTNENYFDLVSEAISLSKVHPQFYNQIKLENNKLHKLLELQKRVKEELKDYEILHKDKRGVNVVVKHDPKVIEYCERNNYPYVLCPKYIRVNENAISIELKRLNL